MADEIEQSGASEQPVAPAPSQGTAAPASPPQSPPDKVDLTTIPQFREYQSKVDRERQARDEQLARLQNQLTQVSAEQARLAAERQQAELSQIEALDPAEQAKFLRQRLAQVERERQEQARQAEITNQVVSILNDAGLQMNDPRLSAVWAIGAKPEAIPALARTIAVIQRQDTERLKAELEEVRKPKPQARSATQQAVVQALDEAGVTQTSNAQTVVPRGNPNEEMRKKLLAEYRTFAGKGVDNPHYRNFALRLSQMGKDTGDLYTPWE